MYNLVVVTFSPNDESVCRRRQTTTDALIVILPKCKIYVDIFSRVLHVGQQTLYDEPPNFCPLLTQVATPLKASWLCLEGPKPNPNPRTLQSYSLIIIGFWTSLSCNSFGPNRGMSATNIAAEHRATRKMRNRLSISWTKTLSIITLFVVVGTGGGYTLKARINVRI